MPINEKIEYFTEQESKSLNQDQSITIKSLEFGFSENSTVNFEVQYTRKFFHDEKRINPKQFVEKEEMHCAHHSSGNYIDSSVYYLCEGCKTQLASFKEFNRVVDAYRFRGIGKPWTAETILQVDGPLGLFENLINVDVDMHEDTPNATRLTHRNIYCENCSNELGFQILTLQPDTDAIYSEGQHYIFMNKLHLQRQW